MTLLCRTLLARAACGLTSRRGVKNFERTVAVSEVILPSLTNQALTECYAASDTGGGTVLTQRRCVLITLD